MTIIHTSTFLHTLAMDTKRIFCQGKDQEKCRQLAYHRQRKSQGICHVKEHNFFDAHQIQYQITQLDRFHFKLEAGAHRDSSTAACSSIDSFPRSSCCIMVSSNERNYIVCDKDKMLSNMCMGAAVIHRIWYGASTRTNPITPIDPLFTRLHVPLKVQYTNCGTQVGNCLLFQWGRRRPALSSSTLL